MSIELMNFLSIYVLSLSLRMMQKHNGRIIE